MSPDLDDFVFEPDLQREEQAKQRGMSLAAANQAHALTLARRFARRVAIEGDGTADIERVRQRLAEHRIELSWGNWAGSVFREACWRPTSIFRKAAHEGGHNRLVRVWKLN